MPDIKVTKVEVKHSTQYGDKKVLHLEDGTKWNVSEKKAFYDDVNGPGIYSVDFKEFQGKSYISYLRFKGALDGQNQPTISAPAAGGSTMAKAGYDASLKARLLADKKRQDDIRLEFYCGVAKDILIANKGKDENIKPDGVMELGISLYKKHLELLEIAQMQEEGKKEAGVGVADTTYNRAKAALDDKKEMSEEDIPF